MNKKSLKSAFPNAIRMDGVQKNVLIGGTGFIGSVLASELLARGESVRIVGRDVPEKKIDGVEYFQIDLERDTDSLPGILGKDGNVFLLIGQVSPEFDSVKELGIFEKTLDVIRMATPASIVFTSSVLVYGEASTPASEDRDPDPKDEYSRFKVACENIIREKLAGSPVAVARLSNVYGSEKNRGFIGLLFRKALDGSEMRVNGDGLQERDYVFVDDVAKALIALRNGIHGFDIVNVATGRSATLLEVIRLAGAAIGKEIPYQITGVPVDEVGVSRIDATKLRDRYGFEARTSLEVGLKKTWERYRLHI